MCYLNGRLSLVAWGTKSDVRGHGRMSGMSVAIRVSWRAAACGDFTSAENEQPLMRDERIRPAPGETEVGEGNTCRRRAMKIWMAMLVTDAAS